MWIYEPDITKHRKIEHKVYICCVFFRICWQNVLSNVTVCISYLQNAQASKGRYYIRTEHEKLTQSNEVHLEKSHVSDKMVQKIGCLRVSKPPLPEFPHPGRENGGGVGGAPPPSVSLHDCIDLHSECFLCPWRR